MLALLLKAWLRGNILFAFLLLWIKIYSLHGPELLKDFYVARVEAFLVILSPFYEQGISFLNKSFKFAEDAAAELHVTFSKYVGNECAVRFSASSSDCSHNFHGDILSSLSMDRLWRNIWDRLLKVWGWYNNVSVDTSLKKKAWSHLLDFLCWLRRFWHHDFFNVLIRFLTNIRVVLTVLKLILEVPILLKDRCRGYIWGCSCV